MANQEDASSSAAKVKLTPAQVFTPARAPLKETNVFVRRADAESELQSAVNQNDVPVIFGEFGVGKTSLALWYFRAESEEGRLVHYTNPENKSLDDVYRQALEHIGYAVDVSEDVTSKLSANAEAEVGFWSAFKAKAGVSREMQDAVHRELVVRSPTDSAVLKVLEVERLVLLIDELHRADARFRSDLARLIKSLSDRGGDYPKLVVAGTSTQPELLVQMDKGVDRLIREVPVRPLTTQESKQVVVEGFAKLDLRVAEDLLGKVVSTAAGAPSLLHTICLEASTRALSRDALEVFDEDVDEAIKIVVSRHYHRLTGRYMKATNTMGVKRYRGKILQACAESDNDFITMEILVERVSTLVGEEVSRTRLSEPLRQLKSREYGEILADVARSDGEGRHYNLTVFSDPQMKAYVRFLLSLEARGALPEGLEQDDV